ncbi:MAG: ribosomal protein S18-alanine N-acetyltransferase [Candidatus Bathyarchaeia archaeon]
MSPAIRPFRPDDLRRIHEIETASFRDPWPRGFFMCMHREASDLFLVAVMGGRVVGYAVGELRDNMHGGPAGPLRIGRVLNIAVEAGERRRGVGTRLMEELELRFRRRKATAAVLEVRESNTAARSFYGGLGYREAGRLTAYYGDEDAVVMFKDL